MSTTTTEHPLTGDHAELYELWLKPNGIIGWMPENATVTVDAKAGTITWPKWRHSGNDGPWGHDVVIAMDLDPNLRPVPGGGSVEGAGDAPVVDETTAPLKVAVTERVRDLCRETGVNLVEC